MKYLRWGNNHEQGYCAVEIPIIDNDPLDSGKSLLVDWSNDLTTKMDDDYPDDIELADNLYGSYHAIISKRIVNILRQQLPEESVEFLPIKIINHKGREEAAPYYLLHPIEVIDCIDQEASKVRWNRLAPDEITTCRGLVLIKENIPTHSKLFRLKHWGSKILIREDLAELLKSQNLTGLHFPKADGYKGIG